MKRLIIVSSRHIAALSAAVDAQPPVLPSQVAVSPTILAADYAVGLAEGCEPAPEATATDQAFQADLVALGVRVRASRAGQQIASFTIADALFAKLDAEANAPVAQADSPSRTVRSVPTEGLPLGQVHAEYTHAEAAENQKVAPLHYGTLKLSRVRIGLGIGAAVTTMFAAAAALALFFNSHPGTVAALATGAKPAAHGSPEHSPRTADSEPTWVASAEGPGTAATNGDVRHGVGSDEAVVGRVEAPSSVSVFYVPALNKAASSVVVWISDEPQKPAAVPGDR